MAQRVTRDEEWHGDGASDADLVQRCLHGQAAAFEPLFDRYARQVYSIAYRFSGNAAEAEDLTQDTFLQAYRALPTLRQPQAFAAWLSHIAANTSLDALRRRRLPAVAFTEAIEQTYPDETRWQAPQDVTLAGEEQRAVWATLARLAPSQRAALSLREMHGLSYAAIATTLGVSVGAVEVLLFRARRRFREQYAVVMSGSMQTKQQLRCKDVRASLAAVLDDEGRGTERAAVLMHVRGCAGCRAEIAAQREAQKIRMLVPLLPLPVGVKAGLLAHLGPALGGMLAAPTTAGHTTAAGTAASTAASAGTAASASIAGTAITPTTSGVAGALGVKIAALLSVKAAVVAAGLIAVATVTLATPLLHRSGGSHVAAPRAARPPAAHHAAPRPIAPTILPRRLGARRITPATRVQPATGHTRQRSVMRKPHRLVSLIQRRRLVHRGPLKRAVHVMRQLHLVHHTAPRRPFHHTAPRRPVHRVQQRRRAGHAQQRRLGGFMQRRRAGYRSAARHSAVHRVLPRVMRGRQVSRRQRTPAHPVHPTRRYVKQTRAHSHSSRSHSMIAIPAHRRSRLVRHRLHHVHHARLAPITRQPRAARQTRPAHGPRAARHIHLVRHPRVARYTHLTRHARVARHIHPAYHPRSTRYTHLARRARHTRHAHPAHRTRRVRATPHAHRVRHGRVAGLVHATRHVRRTHQHIVARRAAPRRHHGNHGRASLPLTVVWPRGATLRFDRPQALRVTTTPGALVTVSLLFARQGVAPWLSVGQHRVPRRVTRAYRYTVHARANARGAAIVSLRYAYVPQHPTHATLSVVARATGVSVSRSAAVLVVRQ